LDAERLAGLLAADAFKSSEVLQPATNLRTALRSWRTEIASLCGGDPWAMPANELAGWAISTSTALPAISSGIRALTGIGQRPTTVRALVDDLLLRENVAEWDRTTADDTHHRTTPRTESGSA
jgi:hypothetical protein